MHVEEDVCEAELQFYESVVKIRDERARNEISTMNV